MISSALTILAVSLPAVLGATLNVQVSSASGQLAYNPESVTANPGDIINFTFNPKNHTVTQSSFDTPCVPLPGGATTGFVPVPVGTTPQNLPFKQFTVPPGNAPLWFYCGQTGHCGQGMVFAINAPADPAPNSFSQFKARAIAQNGTAASAPPTTSTATAPAGTVTTDPNFTTPPAPQWSSATATVTYAGSTYTTTYSSYLGTPPPTPAPQPMDHKILVGENGLVYSPANITAAIGDTVTFEFHPKNHTVTQSSFLNPCQALEATSGTPGFKSGFMPVDAAATTFPTFQIKINDTAPIWGYCGQPTHCQQGMVFAINAVESGPNNFENFVQLALRSNGSAAGTATGTAAPGATTTKSGALGGQRSSALAVMAGASVAGLVALML